ncbi:MAG: hypothetical protein K5905_02280 [Roseibium sp.]|uniref:hypothetical protein n=1 Tax=Roseibium sp. TaxID=1936156 RepID=UPI00262285C3|nr:hypothetical protein [Roseibium sp.]MCV0424276.1 hypothetical protein [Roseibium sp.]
MRTTTALALLMAICPAAEASAQKDWDSALRAETVEVLAAQVTLRDRLSKLGGVLKENQEMKQVAQWSNWPNIWQNWQNWGNW